MEEAFLHFIWKFQYFDKTELATRDHQMVNVLFPGVHNTDAGPDFKEAKIIVAGLQWNGQVELHVKASEWRQHGHHTDQAYDNVILHVVWDNDKPVQRTDGSLIPTIELKNRVDEKLILNYKHLINNPYKIPCQEQLHQVSDITWVTMLDKALAERMQQKAALVIEALEANNNDWEETAYRLLCRNMGFKINSEAFYELAKSLPYKIIRKHADSPLQVEALLFGQACLFDDDLDEPYQDELKKEYAFLKNKYSLEQNLTEAHWKLLRLRPANFPTVRLAQLSQILTNNLHLFNKFLNISDTSGAASIFKYPLTDYWKNHYQWGKVAAKSGHEIGQASIDNILINTVVPLLFAYGTYMDNNVYVDKAIALLEKIKSEKNKILDIWTNLDRKPLSAYDSQALIQLYNNYCKRRRCLSCSMGLSLVRGK
ncbi:DUF2851 family protein [Fulvivirga sediminis]|uniref:DUF2851 family protein n=1 Tax=Fulvivirga sediminis TaxID=2803949 RepID=A0A937F6K7_9BACT|nr:DUF2851 family protein [Fulvivirga sediminis]MBL3656690.1 DUF2851 family protein [Fulvivirga sediminis]